MTSKEDSIAWLQRRPVDYRASRTGMSEVVEDLDEDGKLGQGFTSVDELQEVDLAGGITRPTYINKKLPEEHKHQIGELLRKYNDCFTWEYTEMAGLSRELVEHALPIKSVFRKPPKNFNPELMDRIKEEIEWLLKAEFIRPCRYADWVLNIMPIEKKNTGKIRVCVDFRNLNRATPIDEYPMPVADALINQASDNKMISFLDGNVGYNQIFMAEDDIFKIAFRCSGFVGLFEWVVMTFGLKNVGATYQRAMNLIFHDLLGVILVVYIDDIVIKSVGFHEHLADLKLTFERMRRYNLKMNPLKCVWSDCWQVLGFIVHEGGIEVDPKR
jgi:hypothetical protein